MTARDHPLHELVAGRIDQAEAIEEQAIEVERAGIQRELDGGWFVGEVLRRRGITARIPVTGADD
ncbi:MAG TPA: hypothetical protein VF253_05355 [Candidatus Limnocylindrales bacterium]